MSLEGDLLRIYWYKNGGFLYQEVPVGKTRIYDEWPNNTKTTTIDGVRVIDNEEEAEVYDRDDYKQQELYEKVKGKTVEVIETREKLDRSVFGEVVAARDLFERQFENNKVIPVIISVEGDPAIEWVCKKHGVKVKVLSFAAVD